MAVDWDEIGTLSNTVGGYDIRTDPLWLLVITAKQGHEGPLDSMHIRMADGGNFPLMRLRHFSASIWPAMHGALPKVTLRPGQIFADYRSIGPHLTRLLPQPPHLSRRCTLPMSRLRLVLTQARDSASESSTTLCRQSKHVTCRSKPRRR